MRRFFSTLVVFLCLWLTITPLTRAEEPDELAAQEEPQSTQPAGPQEIQQRVALVRGLEFKSDVNVRYVEPGGTASSATDRRTQQQSNDSMEVGKAVLEMLDLVPADAKPSQAMYLTLAGYFGDTYNFRQHEMVATGAPGGPDSESEALLVHNYVHALQDQNFDLITPLDEALEPYYNEELKALQALVEGDVVLSTALYAQSNDGVEALQQAAQRGASALASTLGGLPPAIQAQLLFPYVHGAAFVNTLYREGGWDAVNEAYEDPPLSTEQILHPDRYLDGDEPLGFNLPNPANTAGGELSLQAAGVLGEFMLFQYLSTGLGREEAAKAAEGWGGDLYALFKSTSTGEYSLIVATEWDTARDADEFCEGVSALMSGHTEATSTASSRYLRRSSSPNRAWYVAREGASVLLAIGSDERATKTLIRRIPGWEF